MDELNGGEQAVEAQVPQGTEAAQPSGVQASEQGPGPWSKDLEALGLGEHQAVVDKYLREQWQPRVTELEQKYAPFKAFQTPEDGTAAAELLYALRNDPHGTHDYLRTLIEADVGPWPGAETPADTGEEETPAHDPRLNFVDQLMEEREVANQEAEFMKIVNEQKQSIPDLKEDWFAKMILANNGDLEAAVNDYKQVFPAKPIDPPPPTAGDGVTAPPEADKYDGNFDALVKRVMGRK